MDPESLERRLAVDRGDDYVAILGRGLLAHDHLVAIKDAGVSHAVPGHTKGEVRASSRPLRGDWNAPFDVLLGRDGHAANHPPHQWNSCDRHPFLAQLELTVAPWELQVAFPGKGAQVVANRTGRRPPELRAKVAVSRCRLLAAVNTPAYRVQHLRLDRGELLVHRPSSTTQLSGAQIATGRARPCPLSLGAVEVGTTGASLSKLPGSRGWGSLKKSSRTVTSRANATAWARVR